MIYEFEIKSKKHGSFKCTVDSVFKTMLDNYTWTIDYRSSKQVYAYTMTVYRGKKTSIRLHQMIMNTKGKRCVVDHIDGNGLNNCISNLRVGTQGQNRGNSRKGEGKTSVYKGVYWFKLRGKWRAACKGKHLGLFYSEKDAALAYDSYAKETYGEFANLNFSKNI